MRGLKGVLRQLKEVEYYLNSIFSVICEYDLQRFTNITFKLSREGILCGRRDLEDVHKCLSLIQKLERKDGSIGGIKHFMEKSRHYLDEIDSIQNERDRHWKSFAIRRKGRFVVSLKCFQRNIENNL